MSLKHCLSLFSFFCMCKLKIVKCNYILIVNMFCVFHPWLDVELLLQSRYHWILYQPVCDMKYSIDAVHADSYFIMLLNCLFGEDTWGLQCMLGHLSLNFVVLQIKLNCCTLNMSYLFITRRNGFDLVFSRY